MLPPLTQDPDAIGPRGDQDASYSRSGMFDGVFGDNGPGGRNRTNQGPLPPKHFKVVPEGAGVRVLITDRGRMVTQDGQQTGSYRYDIHWTEDVDMASDDSIKAGFIRSIIVKSIPAPGAEGKVATDVIVGTKYLTGYYYCTGVSWDNVRRSRYVGPAQVSTPGVDDSLPTDVDHFDVSESGEVANGAVYSALSFGFRAPNPLGSFDGLQLYLRDYPNIGETSEGWFHRYSGPAGGSAYGKALYPPARRIGVGTITLTNGSAAVVGVGSNFLSQCNAGDKLEALGQILEVQSVTDNLNLILTTPWSPATIAGLADFQFVGLVTIFGVAVSKAGTRRADIENSPSKDVLMDGLLSAPIAPASMAVTGIGNGIRVSLEQVTGTEIDHYAIYRSTGSGDTFTTSKTLKKTILHNPSIPAGVLGSLQWDDVEFSYFERENGQPFRYYVTTVNKRDQESATYATATTTCRLDSGDDGTTGKKESLNLLWNGHICGTLGGIVQQIDAGQDAGMAGFADPAWGGVSSRWQNYVFGGALNVPGHQNTTEVILPWNGLGQGCGIYQDIPAWDHPTDPMIDKNGYINLSLYCYSTGGVPVGGIMIQAEQWDMGVPAALGPMNTRVRLSDDTFDETGGFAAFNSNLFLVDTMYRMIVVFKPDITFAPTTHVRIKIEYRDSIGPANLIVTRAIVGRGLDIPMWQPTYDWDTRFPPVTGVTPAFRDDYRERTKPGFREVP